MGGAGKEGIQQSLQWAIGVFQEMYPPFSGGIWSPFEASGGIEASGGVLKHQKSTITRGDNMTNNAAKV